MIHFDIPKLEENLKKLEAETTNPSFWEDSQKSNTVLSKIKNMIITDKPLIKTTTHKIKRKEELSLIEGK